MVKRQQAFHRSRKTQKYSSLLVIRKMPELSFENLSQVLSLPFLISFRVKTTVHPEVYKTFCDLVTHILIFYYFLLHGSFCQSHICLLIPGQIRNATPSGLWHLLFPLPEMLFPRITYSVSCTFYRPLCICHFLNEPSLTSLFKLLPAPTLEPPIPLKPFSFCYLCICLLTLSLPSPSPQTLKHRAP